MDLRLEGEATVIGSSRTLATVGTGSTIREARQYPRPSPLSRRSTPFTGGGLGSGPAEEPHAHDRTAERARASRDYLSPGCFRDLCRLLRCPSSLSPLGQLLLCEPEVST